MGYFNKLEKHPAGISAITSGISWPGSLLIRTNQIEAGESLPAFYIGYRYFDIARLINSAIMILLLY
jgi:hypothetical protein